MLKRSYNLVVIILTFWSTLSAQEMQSTAYLEAGEWNDLIHWDYWMENASEDFIAAKAHWQWPDLERYSVQVNNQQQVPIPNCDILLINRQRDTLWKSKTDVDGRAELWASEFSNSSLTIIIKHAKNEWTLDQPLPYPQKTNNIEIEADCPQNNQAEIAFVVDATGSMKDEIQFLKTQITSILERAHRVQPNLEIRSGVVFYRDYEESFLVRKMDLTTNYSALMDYVAQQRAAGGGDPTEAVEAALDTAIQRLDWTKDAISRIIFLWMDGPPKNAEVNINQLQNAIKLASEKGIKIVPLMASGADSNTEFLIRNLAFGTNGVFTFLNNATNVKPNHLVPVTETYSTSPLSDLLLKTISHLCTLPACERFHATSKKMMASGLAYEEGLLQKIECFPNPTTEQINIELAIGIDKMSIQNALGQPVMAQESLKKGRTQIKVDHWPAGIYFLHFQKGNAYAIQKLIVE